MRLGLSQGSNKEIGERMKIPLFTLTTLSIFVAITLVAGQGVFAETDQTNPESETDRGPHGYGSKVLFREFDPDSEELLVYYREDILDECLPSAHSQRDHWMESLRDYGLSLTEEFSPELFSLSVSLMGFANAESCVVHVSTNFRTPSGDFTLKDSDSSIRLAASVWKHSSLHASHRAMFAEKVSTQLNRHLDMLLEDFEHYSGRRLLGKWKSSAEKTIKSIESSQEVGEIERQAFLEIFGNSTLEFLGQHVRFYNGVVGVDDVEFSYRVVRATKDQIIIEFYIAERGVEETVAFQFAGDCMSRSLPGQLYRQHYCKVNSPRSGSD